MLMLCESTINYHHYHYYYYCYYDYYYYYSHYYYFLSIYIFNLVSRGINACFCHPGKSEARRECSRTPQRHKEYKDVEKRTSRVKPRTNFMSIFFFFIPSSSFLSHTLFLYGSLFSLLPSFLLSREFSRDEVSGRDSQDYFCGPEF